MPETTTVQPAKFIDAPALTLIGLDQRYTFETMDQIAGLWQLFVPRIGEILGGKGPKGVAYGLTHDFETEGFGYMCGIEAGEDAGVPAGMTKLSFPASRYAVFPHEGTLATICETIDAGQKWLHPSGQAVQGSLGFFERYGENFDPVAMQGDIEIWFPVKGE